MTVSTTTTVATPVTITTAQLAKIIHDTPLGQRISIVMRRPAGNDILKKNRDTKLPTPPRITGLVKTTVIVGHAAGIPKHDDAAIAATGDEAEAGGTSYQRAVNRRRLAAGEDATFESGEDKVNDRIGSTPLMQGKRDGALKLDISPDWKLTRSRYSDATGAEVKRNTLVPYLSASVLNRDDSPPATLRPALASIVEARIGGKCYKVTTPARLTFADVKDLI